MNLKLSLKPNALLSALIFLSTLLSQNVRANVYATNIRLNGGTTNVLANAGDSVTISYILNEPASRGVTIKILSGSSVVRSIAIASTDPGAQTGLNSVVWDGKDGNGNPVNGGTYSVSITAAATGYTNWTQITTDGESTYVYEPRGIDVDRNPSSLYYGRIFVANANIGTGNLPGDVVGVLKLNADASPAEDGANSAGSDGVNWSGNHLGPWKLRVSADDHVYVNDLANGGEVYRWDPTMSSNSLVQVLTTNNQTPGATLNSLALVGTGTNQQLWMADSTGTNGVLKWALTNVDATCGTNDLGQTIVGIGGSLTLPPQAADLDPKGNVYTCQAVQFNNDPASRVFQFPPYDPSTNKDQPELNANWSVGANDDSYEAASGIAVDPTGTYVAVAFEGFNQGVVDGSGNTKVLSASNGGLVANLDYGILTDPPATDPEHSDTDCAWDAAGNVYCTDNWYGYWRAYSPPGTNQATTLALMQIQVAGSAVSGPTVTGITVTNGVVAIFFSGSAGDVASDFSVLGAANVLGPYQTLGLANISQTGSGTFVATLAASSSIQFYRIQRGAAPALPAITSVSITAGVVTLRFTGSANDVPGNFTVMSSPTLNGQFSAAANVTISQVSSGVFNATVPASGPSQFYRIRK